MSEHNHTTDNFDDFYAAGPQWSGAANDALVRETAGLIGGTALDIGCGEGADVAWLAEQGWTVTGVDPAAAAIDRTRQLVDARGLTDQVSLAIGGITAVEGQTFDLVIGFYVPLADDDIRSVRAVEKLLAPDGALIWVHHIGHHHPVLSPAQVAEQLEQLRVVKLENTTRRVSHGAGAGQKMDQVLVARRD